MSTPAVKCQCAHRRHQGQCPRRSCGCLRFRPRAAALTPAPPRVVAGQVERERQAVTS